MTAEQARLIATRPREDASPHDRGSLRGVITIFCVTLVVFCVSSYTASCFPRGAAGRKRTTSFEVMSSSIVAPEDTYEDVLSSLAPGEVIASS